MRTPKLALAAASQDTATKPVDPVWQAHLEAVREAGLIRPELYTALILHRHGIMTNSAKGQAPRRDDFGNVHVNEYTRDCLERAGMITEDGKLTALGFQTIDLLERPRNGHYWAHHVHDGLRAHIERNAPKPQDL